MEVINILRVSFYEYRPKTLKIQFEYDKLTVGKIKRIPGREYLENKQEGKMWLIPYHQVSELTKSFDLEEIHFDESIDINYKETKGYDFVKEIALFKNNDFKVFARYIIKHVPEYVLTDMHLIAKIQSTVKIAQALAEANDLDSAQHDILITSALFHKMYQYSVNKGQEKVIIENHAQVCVETVEKILDEQYEYLDNTILRVYNAYWKDIALCIKAYQAERNIDGKMVKSPAPKTKLQKLMRESSYLASCDYIKVDVR